MELEWKDPPNNRSKADIVTEELRKNPGRWARIAKGVNAFYTGERWWFALSPVYIEVIHIPVDVLTKDVYARYVGDSETKESDDG